MACCTSNASVRFESVGFTIAKLFSSNCGLSAEAIGELTLWCIRGTSADRSSLCTETWQMEEFLNLTKEYHLMTGERAIGATGYVHYTNVILGAFCGGRFHAPG